MVPFYRALDLLDSVPDLPRGPELLLGMYAE
jgi:hypothetical protein